MAVDVFLKIGDIKGESKDSKHAGEIDVLSWSWGVSNPTSMEGSGLGTGRASFGDLSFMHAADKASTALMTLCATGEHVKEAVLIARKAGKTPQEYLTIKMETVFVSSVQLSGSSEIPMESVSLAYSKINIDYKPQKGDGSLDAAATFSYNLAEKKKG